MHDTLRHQRTCVRLFGCSFVLKSSLTTEVGCQGMVVGSRFESGSAELSCASLGQVRCSVLQCSRGSRELLSFRWPSRTVKCSGWSSANHAHAFVIPRRAYPSAPPLSHIEADEEVHSAPLLRCTSVLPSSHPASRHEPLVLALSLLISTGTGWSAVMLLAHRPLSSSSSHTCMCATVKNVSELT